MKLQRLIIFLFIAFSVFQCKEDEQENLALTHVWVSTLELDLTAAADNNNIPVDQSIVFSFSHPLNPATVAGSVLLKDNGTAVPYSISFFNQNKSFSITPTDYLLNNTTYTITLTDDLRGSKNEVFASTDINFTTAVGSLKIDAIKIGGNEIIQNDLVTNIARTLAIEINFSHPLLPSTVTAANISLQGSDPGMLQFTLSESNKKLTITSSNTLRHLSRYKILLSSSVKGSASETFGGYSRTFYTAVDPAPKFPVLPNDEDNDNDNTNDLLSVVQKQTFKYFWDYADPSGMAYERNGANYVTSGGSGFGIMALIVGMQRNFILREDGLARMDKILTFLEGADRFHGAWPHWMYGNGDVKPFSPDDNGGDLVETALLVEGLITFRQYITNNSIPNSYNIVNRINTLWEAVEWDWYRRNNQNVLYWHWSPDKTLNVPIQGWNECLITYVLAASSSAHSIPKSVYTNGWARNGQMINGNSYESITLPLGFPSGGPLFFTHYSFLGLDARDLIDPYAAYWTQNVNHALINYKYCVRNPKKFVGYGENCWGLTASDSNVGGYNAHSPTNDLGVITPTAALSSFPYTPQESMRALKFFYYTLGDRLWGEYGFYDAFNITDDWYANSYLAIDQGPIIVMIENYRTGLLWDLFMSAPEVQSGLTKLGFSY